MSYIATFHFTADKSSPASHREEIFDTIEAADAWASALIEKLKAQYNYFNASAQIVEKSEKGFTIIKEFSFRYYFRFKKR